MSQSNNHFVLQLNTTDVIPGFVASHFGFFIFTVMTMTSSHTAEGMFALLDQAMVNDRVPTWDGTGGAVGFKAYKTIANGKRA